MRAAVIALGKIGLPLAVQIARSGVPTIGVDIAPAVVDLVNRGQEPFPGEEGLAEALAEVIDSGVLRATTSTQEAVQEADAVVVVVPLVVDETGTPDFGAMDSATQEIAAGLRPGTLVSYETTLPVGTTRGRFLPMLEQGSGLRVGTEFHLVHSPERVYSGRIFRDLRSYPKLVGGITPECTRVGMAFYERILDFDERPDLSVPNGVWDLGSAEAAELAKLAETTYRDVNIALANEFARFAESQGIDVHRVIEASNSQPFSHIHRPGVAVGGHCIPVYPRFYLHGAPAADLVEVARVTNESVPRRVVDDVSQLLDGLGGKTVLVLGVSYRGGVKETAFSGVYPLVEAIEGRGGVAVVHDPLYTSAEISRLGLRPWVEASPVDAVILQADHAEYRSWVPSRIPGVRVIYDGRSMLDPILWSGEGRVYRSIGVGDPKASSS